MTIKEKIMKWLRAVPEEKVNELAQEKINKAVADALRKQSEESATREEFWQNFTEDLKKEKAILEAENEGLNAAAKADAEIIKEQRVRYSDLKKHHEKVMDAIKLVEVDASGNDVDSALELFKRIMPYIHVSNGDEEPGKFFYIQVVEE